jgi:hypothetical protein
VSKATASACFLPLNNLTDTGNRSKIAHVGRYFFQGNGQNPAANCPAKNIFDFFGNFQNFLNRLGALV